MQTIYLTPHTHYDAAWVFTKDEYLMINEKIVEEAVNLMETRISSLPWNKPLC